MTLSQQITISATVWIGVFIALLMVVWLSGSMFGQRCTAAGYSGASWENCVQRLAQGEPVWDQNADPQRLTSE